MPWQQRVINEKVELDEKIGRLIEFALTQVAAELPAEDQNLLSDQLRLMSEYSAVLGLRIARFAHG